PKTPGCIFIVLRAREEPARCSRCLICYSVLTHSLLINLLIGKFCSEELTCSKQILIKNGNIALYVRALISLKCFIVIAKSKPQPLSNRGQLGNGRMNMHKLSCPCPCACEMVAYPNSNNSGTGTHTGTGTKKV